jgi:hypothetical protein
MAACLTVLVEPDPLPPHPPSASLVYETPTSTPLTHRAGLAPGRDVHLDAHLGLALPPVAALLNQLAETGPNDARGDRRDADRQHRDNPRQYLDNACNRQRCILS